MSSEDLKGIEDTSPVSGTYNNFCIIVRDADLAALSAHMPVIAYVGGYFAHAAMKVLKCESCQESLVVDEEEGELESDPHSLITRLNRGGLKLPSPFVVTVVVPTEVVIKKLTEENHFSEFLQAQYQKKLVRQLTLQSLPQFQEVTECANGHTCELLVH
ncbi:hypothetical protein HPB49_009364 [Dermacentor silvarum]|uniref:Uncharacterized protein n=1 Tax=Dermacentor silvarum TaxID=543639 RepID=A0ACB8CQR1_DERSI|nr:hypothetical protein HPB49_009364 [Dermacentor silvarum]